MEEAWKGNSSEVHAIKNRKKKGKYWGKFDTEFLQSPEGYWLQMFL